MIYTKNPFDDILNSKVSCDSPRTKKTDNIEDDNHVNVNTCSRLRIILLLQHLYQKVNKMYFYKPSYLILMKVNVRHCKSASDFINTYFKDFLSQLSSETFIGKILFPVREKKRREKKRLITLEENAVPSEDEFEDDLVLKQALSALKAGIYDSSKTLRLEDNENATNEMSRNKDEFESEKLNVNKIKLKKGMIESEESEEINTSILNTDNLI